MSTFDRRFDTLEKRVEDGFTVVDEHFAEQRAHIEFAFARVEQKVETVEQKVETLERTMTGRFDRLDRKLDQFIEAQLRTNERVDRRLQALESPGGPSA